MENENNVTTSGSDSERDTSGSVGSASGTGKNGSAGRVDGSGGNANGNDTGNGKGAGSDNTGNGGTVSAEPIGNNGESSAEPANGNINESRPARRDRARSAGSIRLGSAVRNSDTSAGTDTGNGSDSAEELDSEPVIRLGAKKQGRPRAEAKADDSTELKLSELRDLISMFLSSIFEIPAVTMRQDFWRLNKDENKVLTDALVGYIKSMPKSKSNWITTFIQENLPLVNLIMVGFFIVSDRVKGSIAIAQVNKFGRATTQSTATAEKPRSSATVSTPLDSMFS
jgi:hypothetical protein